MNFLSLALVTLIFPVLSWAAQPLFDSTLCPRRLEGIDNIQVHQSLSGDNTKCYLSIHPRDAFETLIYRDYLLTSEGMLLVFNSLLPYEGPGSHGGREFFVFPSEFKGFQWQVKGSELVVTGFHDLTMKFSLQTAQITAISDADIMVAKKVEASNKGGLEILRTLWPLVDTGFLLNGAPSYDANRFSLVRNAKGEACRLSNKELFDYSTGDAQIRDRETIAQLARKTCEGFVLNAIRTYR